VTEFEEKLVDDVMGVSAFANGHHENLTVFNQASDTYVDFFTILHEDEDSIEAMLGELYSVGACAAVSISDPMSILVGEVTDLEDECAWEHLRANDDWPEAWNTPRYQQEVANATNQVLQDYIQHNDHEEQD
jgi:hypothetical protein